MADIIKIFLTGRLVKDPETRTYGAQDELLCTFNVACTDGFGDKKKTLYFNCSAFKHTAKAISEGFKQGDSITIEGKPTQNKKDDKVYHGIAVSSFNYGQKKKGESSSVGSTGNNSFEDDDIPF